MTSPHPKGIIIPIVSENLPFHGEKEGIDNAFGSELQALAMIFAQKKGIDNAFRSKGRHCQCLWVKRMARQNSLTVFTCNIGMAVSEIFVLVMYPCIVKSSVCIGMA